MKTFKRLICMVIASAMLIGLVACGGADIKGYWIISSMKEGETEYNLEQLEGMGFDKSQFFFVFEDGGKGYASFYGDEKELTYDGSKITIDGDAQEYSVSGDTLTFTMEDSEMKFTKSTDTPPARGASGSSDATSDEADTTSEETETTE